MRAVEDPSITVLDMNEKYEILIDKLEIWSKDATPILSGQALLFSGYAGPSEDRVHESLLESTDQDDKVKALVEVICAGIAENTKELFKDHLPGGKFSSMSHRAKSKTKSCMSHNTTLERLMAKQDKSMATVSHCNQVIREAKLMYIGNKPKMRSDSLPPEELSSRIRRAQRTFRHRRKKLV